eukprot:NODE_87_length_21935_cov_0.397142.p1 type:complete len:934 gc:universal NODE_87_length_21935_cov_0.397142:18952-21753(+)
MYLFTDDQFTLVLEVEINSKKIYFAIFHNGQFINFIKVDIIQSSQPKKLQIEGVIGLFEEKESSNQLNMTPYYLCVATKISNVARDYDEIHKIQFVHIPKKPTQWLVIDNLLPIMDQQHPLYDLDLYLNEQPFYRISKLNVDNQYVWNYSSIKPFIKILDMYDISHSCLVFLVLGFVEQLVVPLQQQQIELSVISLVSSKRAGTRYAKRGIDDQGYCSNQVYSRLFISLNSKFWSFELVRASVPAFWEQSVNKCTITRPLLSTLPACSNHFTQLFKNGNFLLLVNLLDNNGVEGELSDLYEALVNEMRQQFYDCEIDYIHFQYSSLVKQAQDVYLLKHLLLPSLSKLKYTYNANNESTQQLGVIRINCLDVLDRTNVIHHLIFTMLLETMAKDHPVLKALLQPQVLMSFNELFANHGDILSKIYTGTGAVKSSFTRHGKMTWAGVLDDGLKSINRYVNTMTTDVTKQMVIEWFINNKCIIQNDLTASAYAYLKDQEAKFKSFKEIDIYCCTWNVNGQLPYADVTGIIKNSSNASIICIGLQEIVELTPNQVISTDTEKKQIWLNKFNDLLAGYHLLKCLQLVGTALFVFAHDSILGAVSKVDYKIKKTGFSGMAGNKGGIMISMNIFDSSFIFITSHLAAGQDQVIDRHKDFSTINESIANVDSKPCIIWCGDFNYRIDFYTNEQIKQHISQGNLNLLQQYDQLINAMMNGVAFGDYIEHPIQFNPTYKYDNGTDLYDTSEKQRKPAWTDRIVFKGDLGCLEYNSLPMRVSDHKAVYALFKSRVLVIDHAKRRELLQQCLQSSKVKQELIDLNDSHHSDLLIKTPGDTMKRRMSMTKRKEIVPKRSSQIGSLIDLETPPELPKRMVSGINELNMINNIENVKPPLLPSRENLLIDIAEPPILPKRKVPPEIPPKPSMSKSSSIAEKIQQLGIE